MVGLHLDDASIRASSRLSAAGGWTEGDQWGVLENLSTRDVSFPSKSEPIKAISNGKEPKCLPGSQEPPLLLARAVAFCQ